MNTEQLIADTKARFNHNAQKAQLKDKYQSKLIFAHGNGMWTASPELISILNNYSNSTIILIDDYENPVQVDVVKLLNKTIQVYESVMKQYLAEWQELENKR